MFKWLFKKKGCAKHMNNKLEVIGIDHGWSMMKTISQVFVTGVKEITTTPALFGDVLEYEGKFYKVGAVRQEVKDTKVEDDSFYLLTLAAVAKELKRRGLAEAKVFLAVGLPLTRFGAEKNDFIKYLTKNKRVSFKYENESYHIEIDDVAVFPQCYAAVVDKIPAMAKKTLIVDIGSWTIDIMPVINKSPDESKCVTIPKGLITCMRSINEQCVRQLNGEVDESEIQNIMRYGRSDIDDEYFAIIKAKIEDFVDKVYNSIREFGYNLKTTPIVFVGGGAVVMKNFGSHDAKNISYNLDVKDGKAAFTSDLPLGQYYVKEIEAPKGYVKSDKIFDVDASYQGDKVKVIEFEAAFENAPIKVEISKTDITGEKELPGAKLSVIDADGKLVESWTSEAGKTYMIERLPVGKYTLREESAPYGYKVAKDVTFEVKETAEIQKVSMKDEQAVGKIVIEKTDKVTGKPIEGVVFEVRDKDGKVLDTLTTDKNGHAESKELPICTYNEDGSFKEDIHYTVVETKAADGYILDETAHDVTLRYDDNAPDVVVTTLKLVNVPTEPKLPQTGDNANPLLYLGIGALALITGVGVGLRGRKKKNKQ